MSQMSPEDELQTIGDTLAARELSDQDVRFMEPDEVFALNPLRDDCIEAAARAKARFLPSVPGWELYARITRGDKMFDRRLAAWAIGLMRGYARARMIPGHRGWQAQAALDALELTLTGRPPPFPIGQFVPRAIKRDHDRARDDVSALMLYGLQQYTAELHYHYNRIKQENFAAELACYN
jgi:hypothetical protein